MYEINLSYEFDYSALDDFVNVVNNNVEGGSKTVEAFKAAGQLITATWIRLAGEAFSSKSGGSYINGILAGLQYPYNNDILHLRVENRAKHAHLLENGVDPYDMKTMLTTSSKVRVSKEGHRYLIIPFKHSASSMGKSVRLEARRLQPSFITGRRAEGVVQKYRPLNKHIGEEQGAKYYREALSDRINNPYKIERRTYKWGNSLKVTLQRENSKKYYVRLYRFENNVNIVRDEIKQKTSLGKFATSNLSNKSDNNQQYSSFINFCIMSERSTGWLHPGIRAMHLCKRTREDTENRITAMIREGLVADLNNLGF